VVVWNSASALTMPSARVQRDADTTVSWYRLDTLGTDALPFHPVSRSIWAGDNIPLRDVA